MSFNDSTALLSVDVVLVTMGDLLVVIPSWMNAIDRPGYWLITFSPPLVPLFEHVSQAPQGFSHGRAVALQKLDCMAFSMNGISLLVRARLNYGERQARKGSPGTLRPTIAYVPQQNIYQQCCSSGMCEFRTDLCAYV